MADVVDIVKQNKAKVEKLFLHSIKEKTKSENVGITKIVLERTDKY